MLSAQAAAGDGSCWHGAKVRGRWRGKWEEGSRGGGPEAVGGAEVVWRWGESFEMTKTGRGYKHFSGEDFNSKGFC